MSRGIRQGCPISALLFVLSVEILGIQIRQQTNLPGLDFGFPNKVKLYSMQMNVLCS